MHLALNFQRVDPVARRRRDLRRRPLPGPGPGRPSGGPLCGELRRRLPAPRGERRSRGRAAGGPSSSASGASPGIPSRRCGTGRHECSVGFINTWAHDVIIPQGGVQEGSLRANAATVPDGLQRRALSAVEGGQSQVLGLSGDRAQAVRPGATARFVAVSEMVRRHLEEFHHVPRQQIHVVPNAIDSERIDVAQPGAVAVRSATGWAWSRATWSACSSATTSRSRVCKPLIEALGAGSNGDRGRAIHLLVCGGGNPAPYLRLAQEPGDPGLRPFPGLLPGRPRMLLVQRLLRPANLLRPLLAGRPGGAGVRAARDHDRAERRRRADDRWPRGLHADVTRGPGRADRRPSIG